MKSLEELLFRKKNKKKYIQYRGMWHINNEVNVITIYNKYQVPTSLKSLYYFTR